jgi:hypothetical protein
MRVTWLCTCCAINDNRVEPDERHLMLLDEFEAYWRTMGEADWPRLIALP